MEHPKWSIMTLYQQDLKALKFLGLKEKDAEPIARYLALHHFVSSAKTELEQLSAQSET
jgi:hypothetical protein